MTTQCDDVLCCLRGWLMSLLETSTACQFRKWLQRQFHVLLLDWLLSDKVLERRWLTIIIHLSRAAASAIFSDHICRTIELVVLRCLFNGGSRVHWSISGCRVLVLYDHRRLVLRRRLLVFVWRISDFGCGEVAIAWCKAWLRVDEVPDITLLSCVILYDDGGGAWSWLLLWCWRVELVMWGAAAFSRMTTTITHEEIVQTALTLSHLSVRLMVGTTLSTSSRIRDLKVRLLVINHIFTEVKVEQSAFLAVNYGLALQFVTFSFKSCLELLLRVWAIYVPVYTFNFLLKEAVLLTRISAILNLVDDTLGVWPHKRALRHAHGHHLLVCSRCTITICAVFAKAALLVDRAWILLLQMVRASAMTCCHSEHWMGDHHHVPSCRCRLTKVLDNRADDLTLRSLLQIWIIDWKVVRFQVFSLVQSVLLISLLMHLSKLGATLSAGLFDREMAHCSIPIVSNGVIRMAELRLEWDRALLVLDMLTAISLLDLDIAIICLLLCLSRIFGHTVRGLSVLIDDRLEIWRCLIRTACGVSCLMTRWKGYTALLHPFVQLTDGLEVAARVICCRGTCLWFKIVRVQPLVVVCHLVLWWGQVFYSNLWANRWRHNWPLLRLFWWKEQLFLASATLIHHGRVSAAANDIRLAVLPSQRRVHILWLRLHFLPSHIVCLIEHHGAATATSSSWITLNIGPIEATMAVTLGELLIEFEAGRVALCLGWPWHHI